MNHDIEILKVPRNAVLPQLLTWETQVGALCVDLKFPGASPVYCHRHISAPEFTKQDHKTLLAVTNAAVEL